MSPVDLVNELQASAESEDVLTVLRKTKRLAMKLGQHDILDWLEHEQSGYPSDAPVPKYRTISTSVVMNTNGYVPCGWGMMMKGIRELPGLDLTIPFPVRDPISAITAWIESIASGNGIYWPLPEGEKYTQAVRRCMWIDPSIERQVSFMLRLNSAQARTIPEHVKNKVLDWACMLEAAGVTGAGLTFSAEEKQIAHSITFNISGSNIEQLNNMGMNQKSAS